MAEVVGWLAALFALLITVPLVRRRLSPYDTGSAAMAIRLVLGAGMLTVHYVLHSMSPTAAFVYVAVALLVGVDVRETFEIAVDDIARFFRLRGQPLDANAPIDSRRPSEGAFAAVHTSQSE